MTSTLSLVKSLDMFGQSPILQIANNPKNSTILGFSLSIIVYALLISMVFYFGSIIVNQENPQIIFSQKNYENPESIYISPSNFSIAIGMENSIFQQYIDESIYKIRAKYIIFDSRNNGFKDKSYELEVGPCSIDYFPSHVRDQFKSAGIPNMYCIKNGTYSLVGTWVQQLMKLVKFQVSACSNTTSNITCQNQSVIDSALSNGFLSIYYVDSTIDPNNITQPAQFFPGQPYALVSNKQYQVTDNYFRLNKVVSDDGLVFTSNSEKTFISSDYSNTLKTNQEPVNQVFYEYNIRLSTLQTKYNRSYMKVPTAAALLGGIFNSFQVICYGILFFYNKLKFSETILNHLYSFKKNHMLRNLKSINFEQVKKSESHFEKNSMIKSTHEINKKDSKSEIPMPEIMKVNNLISESNIEKLKIFLKEEEESEKNKIHISLIDTFFYIFYICCKQKTKKLNFVIEETSHIQAKIDVLYCLDKFNEIEKMKEIIFDEDQILIFNLIPHSQVSDYEVSNRIKGGYSKKGHKKTIKDKEKILNAYDIIRRKVNIKSEEKRLLKLFERLF